MISKGKITLIVNILVIYHICCDRLFQCNTHDSLQINTLVHPIFLVPTNGTS
jgi:hypothetical protein